VKSEKQVYGVSDNVEEKMRELIRILMVTAGIFMVLTTIAWMVI